LWRALERQGHSHLLGKSRTELDLLDGPSVQAFFRAEQPEYVFVAAAKVGGIHANRTYPADFLFENLQLQNNIIRASHDVGVRKLLFLGSSCIYPRLAEQPMKEEALLMGPLEPTNQWYAVAKIAGIKLCQAHRRQYGSDFISVMPANLYGPNDNYDLESSHVLPALIRRFHEAKETGQPEVVLWGTGSPLREFLHVDDLADACLFLMHHYSAEEIINVGSGREVTIRQLAEIVQTTVGYTGAVRWDATQPDGTPRKLMDCTQLTALGWKPSIGLERGIREVYAAYVSGLST
jgi:GDP-L-fucose synthase